MSDLDKRVLRPIEKKPGQKSADFLFWCPGCRCCHGVWVSAANSINAQWTFNGNIERPTFAPSLLIRYPYWDPPVTAENLEQWRTAPWKQTQKEKVCHSFVRDGQIQFLGDCTHELAGKTVPMEPF